MLHHMATILVCYGGHFEPKMSAKIQKSSDLGEIWFSSRLWCCELISIVWEPYNIISCCVGCITYYVPQTKFGDLLFLHRFLLLLSPQTKWRLIVFAPFLIIIIIIMNICQNLWPNLYRKLPKGFPQDLAYILNRVGRIF